MGKDSEGAAELEDQCARYHIRPVLSSARDDALPAASATAPATAPATAAAAAEAATAAAAATAGAESTETASARV